MGVGIIKKQTTDTTLYNTQYSGLEGYKKVNTNTPCKNKKYMNNINYQLLYSKARGNSAIVVDFLNYTDAKKIFDEFSTCNYMTPCEIKTKLGFPESLATWTKKRNQWIDLCLTHYSDCILNFTMSEQQQIYDLFIDNPFIKYDAINFKLAFIKINGKFDWNYPFTIGYNNIVLPEELIQKIKYGVMTKKEFGILINHEITHILQRRNQSKYNKLYNDIGYIIVPRNQIITSINTVTNPDDDPEGVLLFKINEKDYIYTTLAYDVRLLANSPSPMCLLMHKRADGKYIQMGYWLMDSNPSLPYLNLMKKAWEKIYPDITLDKITYSPNEIMAGMEE